ncbi:hypothetical protein ACTUVK_001035 [Stenotrophomonas rhizophila]
MHVYRALPLLLSAPMLPFTTHAAASLLVDDAGITDAQQCQLESWVRHTDAGQEWTAVPACTLADTEWSLGLTRAPGEAARHWALGAKHVLVARAPRQWGLALSAGIGGNTYRPRADDWALNLPLTIAPGAQERVQLHLNLGWAKQGAVHGRTDGIGVEIGMTRRWSLLAETAQDAARERGSQLGLRRVLWPGASVDLLAGHLHRQRDSRWITLGFNLAAPP